MASVSLAATASAGPDRDARVRELVAGVVAEMSADGAATADELTGEARKQMLLDSGESLGYLEVCGAKDAPRTLLLVHGNLSSAHSWHPLYRHAGLRGERGWRVVAVEMRGFGASSCKALPASHADNGGDLREFLQKLGGAGPALCVGWSTGGPPVMELAASAPHLVSGVVLWAAVGSNGISSALKGAPATADAQRQGAEYLAGKVAERDVAGLAKVWTRFVASNTLPEQTSLATMLRAALEQPPESLRNTAVLNWAYQGADAAARLKCPVLILHGTADVTLPAEQHAQPWHELLPTSRLVLLDGASHDPMADRLDEAAAHLLDFMRQQ